MPGTPSARRSTSVQVNTPENAKLTFQHVFSDLLQDTIGSNFKFYKRMTDDTQFAEFLIGRLSEEYRRREPRGTDEAM